MNAKAPETDCRSRLSQVNLSDNINNPALTGML